ITNSDSNSEGAYSVSVSNLTGTATSAEAFISLITSPFVLQNPVNILTYPGSNAFFFAVADGAPPLFYQWLFNGVEIADATNSSLTLTNLRVDQEGAYSLQISNSYAVVFTDPASLTIRGQRVILAAPVARTVNAGSSTSFSISADGAPPLIYQWSFNGTNMAGKTNRTLGLSQLQPSQA